MNWVGGTRNRIRTQNERKLQREFFERKKFADKVQVYRHKIGAGIKRNGQSQDLRAFQTVNNFADSNIKGFDLLSRPVKKVDLDVSKPTFPKMVEDIDMGPTSPTSSISKISLMEPRYEDKMKTIKEDSYTNHPTKPKQPLEIKSDLKIPVKFEPFSSSYNFKKPESKYKQFTDFGTDVSRKFKHRDMEPETPMIETFSESSVPAKSNLQYSAFDQKNIVKTNSQNHKSSLVFGEQSYESFQYSARPMFGSNTPVNKPNVQFSETITKIPREPVKKHKKSTDKKNKHVQKPSSPGIFVSEDFQLTPLGKYQNDSVSSEATYKRNSNNINSCHRDSIMSPDIRETVFSSADFIDTPLKRRRFSMSQPSYSCYPQTSTPIAKDSTQLTPEDKTMLHNTVQTCDKMDDINCSNNLTTLFNGRESSCSLPTIENDVLSKFPKCLTPQGKSMVSKRLQTPDIEHTLVWQEPSVFLADVKEFYHLKDEAIYSGNKTECFSPIEGSVFPGDFKDRSKYMTDGKICNHDIMMSTKIALRCSPADFAHSVPTSTTGDETKNKDEKIRKTSPNSQMEEILSELTELENQEMSADELCEELDMIKNNELDCSEWKNNSIINETPVFSADLRQDKVNRGIVTSVLKEIVSKIQSDDDEEYGRIDCCQGTQPIEQTMKDADNSPEADVEPPVFNPSKASNYVFVPTLTSTETQTGSKVLVDSSTSPILMMKFTEDKSTQCSVSRGVSPTFMESCSDKCKSVSTDLCVIPLKTCPVVYLDRLEYEQCVDVKHDDKSDTYCLRSRKPSKDKWTE